MTGEAVHAARSVCSAQARLLAGAGRPARATRVPEEQETEGNAHDDVQDAAPSRVRLEFALPPHLFHVGNPTSLGCIVGLHSCR